MQIAKFMSGGELAIQISRGFVVHKIRVPGSNSKFSAWFTPDGCVTDVERIDAMDRCYEVRHASDAWKYIASTGQRYAAAVYAQ
jgi:hypothetical protein